MPVYMPCFATLRQLNAFYLPMISEQDLLKDDPAKYAGHDAIRGHRIGVDQAKS